MRRGIELRVLTDLTHNFSNRTPPGDHFPRDDESWSEGSRAASIMIQPPQIRPNEDNEVRPRLPQPLKLYNSACVTSKGEAQMDPPPEPRAVAPLEAMAAGLPVLAYPKWLRPRGDRLWCDGLRGRGRF